MSKRHQANRRKSYGRRQHEVRERRQHDPSMSEHEHELDGLGPSSAVPDRVGFLDPRSSRLRFALGD